MSPFSAREANAGAHVDRGGIGSHRSRRRAELAQRHDIVTAGRNSGDVRLDITDAASIRAAFRRSARSTPSSRPTGKVKFAPLEEMQAADFDIGLRDKLMGQVNLVLIGREYVADGGSFTLTSGVLDSDPIRAGDIGVAGQRRAEFIRACRRDRAAATAAHQHR